MLKNLYDVFMFIAKYLLILVCLGNKQNHKTNKPQFLSCYMRNGKDESAEYPYIPMFFGTYYYNESV